MLLVNNAMPPKKMQYEITYQPTTSIAILKLAAGFTLNFPDSYIYSAPDSWIEQHVQGMYVPSIQVYRTHSHSSIVYHDLLISFL